jgi:peptidoglycan/xylan/chitin deacetylase (PgdA/CDA1 family)
MYKNFGNNKAMIKKEGVHMKKRKIVKNEFIRIICLIIINIFCINLIKAKAYGDEFEGLNTKSYDKVVYLTFDDGPTVITPQLLDILKENDVKATFFIVGKEIAGREDILKRIYEEGHGIGLHTYSHNFKNIYRSEETFISEMDKASESVKEILGNDVDIKVIRFPGGSAGQLNENFKNKLNGKGYKIFDWNVCLNDGINPNLSPEAIFQNAKKCKSAKDLRIILAHCNSNNKTTLQALPQIIKYYKELGYNFKIIDNNTAEYFYKFRK